MATASNETYRPSEATRERLAGKSMIAVLGATAVGKTKVIEDVVKLGGHDFHAVCSSTTRERRPEDSLKCRTKKEGFTFEEGRRLINEGLSIVHGIHPTSGDIYVSTADDLSRYNIMPVLPSGLAILENAGFDNTYPIYLVSSVAAYQKHLSIRPDLDDDALKARLQEGERSLGWAIDNAEELSFFENIDGYSELTATDIISNFDKPQRRNERDRGVMLAFAMRSHINDILAT